MRRKDYDPMRRWGCAGVIALYALAAAGFVWLAVMLSGCTRTTYVPVENVRTEYKDKVREVHTTDSVTDTRFVYVKGDTVIDYRDRVKWRDRYVHDTCTVIKTDSIAVPYPVERELTWWQQTKMDFGGMALGAVAVALCVAVVWLLKKCTMHN